MVFTACSLPQERARPHRCLRNLTGRLSFSHPSLFGKLARAQMRARCIKNPIAGIAPLVFPLSKGWFSAVGRRRLLSFPHRLASPRPDNHRWIIYTDAAENPPTLCALLLNGDCSSPDLHTACLARAPAAWPYLLRRTSLIYGVELLGLVRFFENRAAFSSGSVVGRISTTITSRPLSFEVTRTPALSRFLRPLLESGTDVRYMRVVSARSFVSQSRWPPYAQ